MSDKMISINEEGNGFEGIENYYYDEVNRNLDAVEASLNKLKDNPEDQEPIFVILEATKAIADLGMVYGYEGIESLANKMGVVLEKARKTKLTPGIISNLQETVAIIRKVCTLNNDQVGKDIVRQMVSKIVSAKEDKGGEKEEATTPPLEGREEQVTFDIKEMDSLSFLLSENESELNSGIEESEEAIISRSIEEKLKQSPPYSETLSHEEETVKKRKKETLVNKFRHLFGR